MQTATKNGSIIKERALRIPVFRSPAIGKTVCSLLKVYNNIKGRKKIELMADDCAEKIVSYKYKFVVICVPLVASRSFLRLFVCDPIKDFGALVSVDTTQSLLQRLETEDGFLKAAFVRSPWSRTASCYNKKILNANNLRKINRLSRYKGLRPKMKFSSFVDWLCSEHGCDENADRHWLSQYRFLYDEKGNPHFDFIGRLENMESDFKRFCSSAGIKNIRLPWINASVEKPENPIYQNFKDYYNSVTIRKIGERYRIDCELFGYDIGMLST